MEIFFTQQYYLALLIILPIMILIHFISIKLKKKDALRFANFDALARIKGIDIYSKNLTILVLSCLIFFLLVSSLSGATVRLNKAMSNFSFVIAIDSSQSMGANDINPSRIEAAKRTALSFVDSAPLGTRIGVVSFSGNAIIEQLVTDDVSLVKAAIPRISITDASGTDVREAVVTSVNLLINEPNKAIILLSDGQINVGTIDQAVDYAARYGVVVNTVSIGTKEGGQTPYGFSKIDESSLKALSYNTGGNYTEGVDSTKLEEAFSSSLDLKTGPVSINLSRYLILVSLILLVFEYVLINTRYRVFP